MVSVFFYIILFSSLWISYIFVLLNIILFIIAILIFVIISVIVFRIFCIFYNLNLYLNSLCIRFCFVTIQISYCCNKFNFIIYI